MVFELERDLFCFLYNLTNMDKFYAWEVRSACCFLPIPDSLAKYLILHDFKILFGLDKIVAICHVIECEECDGFV